MQKPEPQLMSKTFRTPTRSKMAENPHPLQFGAAHTYIAHRREYPTIGPEISKRKMQFKGVLLFRKCSTFMILQSNIRFLMLRVLASFRTGSWSFFLCYCQSTICGHGTSHVPSLPTPLMFPVLPGDLCECSSSPPFWHVCMKNGGK